MRFFYIENFLKSQVFTLRIFCTWGNTRTNVRFLDSQIHPPPLRQANRGTCAMKRPENNFQKVVTTEMRMCYTYPSEARKARFTTERTAL